MRFGSGHGPLRTDGDLAAGPCRRATRRWPYVTAVREIGAKFKARAVVPLHDAFNKAGMERRHRMGTDGVHPSSSGHMLIARSWLASLGLL